MGAPPKQGLYDPQFEHDSCGVGFVVNMKGRKSHQLVAEALQILMNLDHRGACGCEANTGDGAGILIQTPHEFLEGDAPSSASSCRQPANMASAWCSCRRNPLERNGVKTAFAKIVSAEGQPLLGWRDVPTNNSSLGKTALAAEPHMRQVFLGRNPTLKDEAAFERKLYVIRKRAEQKHPLLQQAGRRQMVLRLQPLVQDDGLQGHAHAGTGGEVLSRPARSGMDTALALVHSRFSTNTFPELEPRPPVSLHRAQRRDQHPARQHQLDACRRRRCSSPTCSATTSRRSLPVINDGRQRLGACSTIASNCSSWRAVVCRTP